MNIRLLVAVTLLAASAANAQTTGHILVANQQSASASIVDLSTGAVTTISVGNGPHEAAISPDGKLGFISIYGLGGAPGNQIAVIDMAEKKVIRTIDLGIYTRPHGMVPVAGSPLKLIVTSETTQNIVTVDADKGVVLSAIPTGAAGSHMVAVPTGAKRAFTANVGAGTLTALDMMSGKATGSVAIAPQSEGLATTPDGNEVWVGSNARGTVSVVNTATMTVDTVLSGFGMPYRMAVSPDQRTAAIVEAEGNKVSLFTVQSRKLIGSVDVGGSPRGVSISPDSKWAFITLGPQNEVVVIDLITRTVTRRFPVGTAPDGVAYSVH